MTAKEILTQAGLHDSHWGQRIIAAEDRGVFTDQDRVDAGEWPDCACGRVTLRIPRFRESKRPKDDDLAQLGIDFSGHVDEGRIFNAAETLIAIEKRAAEILADMEEK